MLMAIDLICERSSGGAVASWSTSALEASPADSALEWARPRMTHGVDDDPDSSRSHVDPLCEPVPNHADRHPGGGCPEEKAHDDVRHEVHSSQGGDGTVRGCSEVIATTDVQLVASPPGAGDLLAGLGLPHVIETILDVVLRGVEIDVGGSLTACSVVSMILGSITDPVITRNVWTSMGESPAFSSPRGRRSSWTRALRLSLFEEPERDPSRQEWENDDGDPQCPHQRHDRRPCDQ